MKKVIITVVIALFAIITTQAQTKTAQKDSVQLFFGMTAEKFLKLTVPEGKVLIKQKKISVGEFLITQVKAENYLLEQKIKKDSIETMRIYDRIDKKLGIKKDGGKD